MSPLEIVANLSNLLSVFLAYRNNIHTWWVGIIATILFAFLFFEVKLYADVTLQFFFIGTSIFGWWNWLKGGQGSQELMVGRVRVPTLLVYVAVSILILIIYGALLHDLTDASYPFIDSVVLVFSVLAQFLLMSRKLETWIFWIVVDLIAVPLFASKGLYLTSAIYFAFLVNAVLGLRNWTKIYARQQAKI